jgi:hypothetical protein
VGKDRKVFGVDICRDISSLCGRYVFWNLDIISNYNLYIGGTMINTFGMEEAKRAGTFAKNKEQKETVYAMLALMGIPVIIKEQAAKLRTKILKKIGKKTDRLDALTVKRQCVGYDLRNLQAEAGGLDATEQDWSL